MLAGRPPFEDTDPLAIMTAHVSREAPMFAEVAPDLRLPAGLEDVVRHGLQKMSAERIQTSNEYLAALDAVLHNAGYATMQPRASGQVAIASALPTPPPGSIMISAAATPSVPFSARLDTAPVGHEPLPKKWLIIAGAVFFLVIVIAIALKLGGGKPAAKPADPAPKPKHSELEAPAPVIAAARPAIAATVDRENAMKAALLDLQNSATCTDRKAAVAKLVELGDPRAIPGLKAARYRMRGGILGFNDANTNACLKADAEEAIKALGGTLK